MVRRITKGKVFVSGFRSKLAGGEWHGIDREHKGRQQNLALVSFDTETGEGFADAQLYALAHNTANELYDLGYDAEEVFKALPETLARIERLEQLAIQYRNDLLRPPSDDSLERRLDAVNAEISQ